MSWCVIEGEALTELRAMPDASVDAVVTDPPYSSGGMVRGDRMQSTSAKYVSSTAAHRGGAANTFTGDNRDQRSFTLWCALWMMECARVTKPGGILASWIDWRNLPALTDAVQAAGYVWQGIVPWVKSNGRPRKGGFRNQCEYVVWASAGPLAKRDEYLTGYMSAPVIPGAKRHHVAEKPVDGVMDELVRAAPEGGVVLDPFAGSGSTGVAALRAGRGFVGFESNPDHAETARCRLQAERVRLLAELVDA